MIRLRLLAGPAIEGVRHEQAQRILKQPKPLALLSYLACENRYVSRHTLLGVFWPELDETRGRAALRKAVFVVRRALGEGVLLSRGDHELSVSAERLWCDAAACAAALRAGDHAGALDLYRGELLPGFYVGRTADFERWLDAQRSRLRTEAERASLHLAQRALEEERYEEMLRWGRRTLEISPHSEEGAFVALTALQRLGSPMRALERYERFARDLHAEYGLAPSPHLRELAVAIRMAGRSTRQGAAAPPGAGEGGGDALLYERFVESATDIMFRLDAQGRFTQVNAATMRVLGYTREQLTGTLYLDLVRDDHHEAALAFYLRQSESRMPSTYYELPVVCADGRVVWLGQNVQIVEEEGRAVGLQAVARDITAQRRAAEAQLGLALRDRATDLFSLRGFHSMAEDRIKLAQRTSHKLILLTLEVGGVEEAGSERAVAAVARLLEGTFRASDVVARTGEHRFAVLALERFERDDEEWREVVGARLQRTALEQELPPALVVTASIPFSGDAARCSAAQLLSACVAVPMAEARRVLPYRVQLPALDPQKAISTPMAGSTGNMLIPERVGGILS